MMTSDREQQLVDAVKAGLSALAWWEDEHGCCAGATNAAIDQMREAIGLSPMVERYQFRLPSGETTEEHLTFEEAAAKYPGATYWRGTRQVDTA